MTNRGRVIAIVLACSILLAGPAFAQCAMCGTALQDADGPLQRGLFWSVVFLISLPYSIVAGFVAFLYWRHRQSSVADRSGRPALRLVTASSTGGNSIGQREVGR